MAESYKQQIISGSRLGFRNSYAEPWNWYEAPISQQVLMISPDRTGYSPIDGLKPILPEAINP